MIENLPMIETRDLLFVHMDLHRVQKNHHKKPLHKNHQQPSTQLPKIL